MLNTQFIGTVSSVLDAAWEAINNEKFLIFDSILASAQTTGRGQYHREWISPKGNIYAALRLPYTPPFIGTEAAVAIGTWITLALRKNGYPAFLKWPNDIVIEQNGRPAKVCGILLEERNHIIIAGIGVNICDFPQSSQLRPNTALSASSLQAIAQLHGLIQPTVKNIWNLLLNQIYSSYTSSFGQICGWHPATAQCLLWKDSLVTLVNGEEQTSGILREIGTNGELILETGGVSRAYLRGSIRYCG